MLSGQRVRIELQSDAVPLFDPSPDLAYSAPWSEAMVRMRNHVTHRQRLFAALALSLLLAGPICAPVMWERTEGMPMRDATRVWTKGVPQ